MEISDLRMSYARSAFSVTNQPGYFGGGTCFIFLFTEQCGTANGGLFAVSGLEVRF